MEGIEEKCPQAKKIFIRMMAGAYRKEDWVHHHQWGMGIERGAKRKIASCKLECHQTKLDWSKSMY
jgi:hypothetical protein